MNYSFFKQFTFQPDIRVFKHKLNYYLSSICVTGRFQIECFDYFGGERIMVHNTSGRPYGVVIQDGVIFYTTIDPDK